METLVQEKKETKNSEAAFGQLHDLTDHMLPQKFGRAGVIWTIFLVAVIALGLFAYIRQLKYGLSVTAMRDYVSWGMYIANFVFLIAVGLVGSLITAILRMTNVHWRAPLTRISETIAVACVLFAAITIVIDMGRPDRIFNLFIYGRLQSPIMWDVIVVTTYLIISVLLLYMPLLPDIAYCRDKMKDIPKWQQKAYKFLALGWTGNKKQYNIIKRGTFILSVLIIPVALNIHTVTSWLFATTYRPGWASTNFGPYFVAGAFMAGAGGVIIAMYVFRKRYGLKNYLTDEHFNKMGKLLVMLSLVYLYFNICEFFTPSYKMTGDEGGFLRDLFTGSYGPMFWAVQIFGMGVPIVVLLFKKGRKPLPAMLVSILVVMGAWFKRWIIVVPTMLHPFLPIEGAPHSWTVYHPTWSEWAITSGTLAGALLVMTIIVRYFPLTSIVEVAEERGIKEETVQQFVEATTI